MSISRVSSKGQITLPASVRRSARIKAGDQLRVDVTDNGIILQLVPDFFKLEGFLGKSHSAEEEESVIQGALDRGRVKK